MRFLVRKRRQTPGVIIIALIDVLIVMLIFLMVTTTFKQHPALKLTLPESSQAKKTGSSQDAVLIISVDTEGDLRLGGNEKALSPEELLSALKAEVQKNPLVKVAIRGDENAPWGKIVKVLDVAKDANLKVANAFTKPAEQTP